jgi:metal-dependent amidase/aminoacylase/carboxypeptidase family protein
MYFRIYVDGNVERSLYFQPETEEQERKTAMEYAAKLERGDSDIEDTIYETPQPTTDEKEN